MDSCRYANFQPFMSFLLVCLFAYLVLYQPVPLVLKSLIFQSMMISLIGINEAIIGVWSFWLWRILFSSILLLFVSEFHILSFFVCLFPVVYSITTIITLFLVKSRKEDYKDNVYVKLSFSLLSKLGKTKSSSNNLAKKLIYFSLEGLVCSREVVSG